MICNWAHVGKQEWQERLGEWLGGTGCDSWVIRRHTQTPWDYTRFWCDAGKTPEQTSDDFERWMAYYKREGIGAISTGFISMRRRRAGTNWFRADDWMERLQEGTGNDVLEGFESQDFLESARDDAVLLNARLRVSPRVRMEQQCKPSNGVWRCMRARLHRMGGLNCSGSVDPLMAGLVVQCDGIGLVQRHLEPIGSITEAPHTVVEPQTVRPPHVRDHGVEIPVAVHVVQRDGRRGVDVGRDAAAGSAKLPGTVVEPQPVRRPPGADHGVEVAVAVDVAERDRRLAAEAAG